MLPWIVRGRSMEPALSDGLRVRGRPLASADAPARGDVLIVRSPSAPRRREIKRVVGLPGERVAWNGQGALWIAGRRLEEPYARLGAAVPGDDEMREARLGAEDYFVAGDNRLHSTDSRRYGPLRIAQLTSRVDIAPRV